MKFNLLMAANDTCWDAPLGEDRSDIFPLYRYLEYTDPGIEEDLKLKPVTAETLRVLEDLPTLFMSELRADPDGIGHGYVTLRAGHVRDLRVEKGQIAFKFVIDRDYGDVRVDDRATFEKTLGLGRWELTRTHWAVKNGDLDTILAMLATPTGTSDEPPEPAESATVSDEPLVADSLETFLSIILPDSGSAGEDVFYRGHSDQRYQLEPSLFRKNDKGGYRHLLNEAYLINELLTAHPSDFASDQYMIDKLVRMQHYGLPTRLLDVTSNPLVALYFCCSTPKYDSDGHEVDGEVIALKTRRSDIKFFNSDTVSCIANLAMLDDDQKNAIDTSSSVEDFKDTDSAQRLLHIIGAEKPYFKPRIVPEHLKSIVFVKGRNSNSRISSQSGAFLLFGHDTILPETGHSTLDIKRIIVRNKTGILEQLAKLNIRSSTIYPGIEKTAAEIAKQHENLG